MYTTIYLNKLDNVLKAILNILSNRKTDFSIYLFFYFLKHKNMSSQITEKNNLSQIKSFFIFLLSFRGIIKIRILITRAE